MSVTVGIDLSAQPVKTAACLIDWRGREGLPLVVPPPLTDRQLIELVRDPQVTKVAIDAPFGWPQPFTKALTTFETTGRWPEVDVQALTLRTTDLVVKRTGQNPLSVSVDKLGRTAIRCAQLLTEIAAPNPVDKTGAGLVAETYPAAALRAWGLSPVGYKRPNAIDIRHGLVRSIASVSGASLRINNDVSAVLAASDHCVDALLCALVAREIELGLTEPIRDEHGDAAASEGWIHLPTARP